MNIDIIEFLLCAVIAAIVIIVLKFYVDRIDKNLDDLKTDIKSLSNEMKDDNKELMNYISVYMKIKRIKILKRYIAY
ncbi:MAG: hypothetical protein ACYCTB_11860 [bacterium]